MTTRCRQTCSSASNRSCRESPSWNCHWCPQFCTTWTRLFRSRSLRRRRDYASRHNGNGTVLSPGNGPLSRSCRRSTSSWNQRKRGKSQSHCSPASTCASTSTLRLKEENGSVPMVEHGASQRVHSRRITSTLSIPTRCCNVEQQHGNNNGVPGHKTKQNIQKPAFFCRNSKGAISSSFIPYARGITQPKPKWSRKQRK